MEQPHEVSFLQTKQPQAPIPLTPRQGIGTTQAPQHPAFPSLVCQSVTPRTDHVYPKDVYPAWRGAGLTPLWFGNTFL